MPCVFSSIINEVKNTVFIMIGTMMDTLSTYGVVYVVSLTSSNKTNNNKNNKILIAKHEELQQKFHGTAKTDESIKT